MSQWCEDGVYSCNLGFTLVNLCAWGESQKKGKKKMIVLGLAWQE